MYGLLGELTPQQKLQRLISRPNREATFSMSLITLLGEKLEYLRQPRQPQREKEDDERRLDITIGRVANRDL